MKDQLSFSRIKNLYQYDWIVHKQKWALWTISIIGVLTVSSLYQAIFFRQAIDQYFHQGWISVLFLAGAVALGTRAFIQLSSPEGVIQYMTIPASKMEKYLVSLSKFTLYFMAMIVLYNVYGLLGMAIWSVADLGHFNTVNFSIGWLAEKYLYYSLIHAIYFLGSAVFRKRAFLKTVASMIIFSIILTILGVVALYFIGEHLMSNEAQVQMRSYMIELQEEQEQTIIYTLRAIGVALLLTLWSVAYGRFKKIQA